MEEKAGKVAELLKALANENRLMILCALRESPLSVNKISEKVPRISQSALSQHLALMKAHGILGSEKNGQSVTYYIDNGIVCELLQALQRHFCDPA